MGYGRNNARITAMFYVWRGVPFAFRENPARALLAVRVRFFDKFYYCGRVVEPVRVVVATLFDYGFNIPAAFFETLYVYFSVRFVGDGFVGVAGYKKQGDPAFGKIFKIVEGVSAKAFH